MRFGPTQQQSLQSNQCEHGADDHDQPDPFGPTDESENDTDAGAERSEDELRFGALLDDQYIRCSLCHPHGPNRHVTASPSRSIFHENGWAISALWNRSRVVQGPSGS